MPAWLVLVALLDGRLAIRLPDGMIVDEDDREGVLDQGGARLTMIASIVRRCGDPRELVTLDRELGSARVELLGRSGAGALYGAGPSFPRRIGDRALVFVAVASAPHGGIAMLRFYVSADGLDRAREWTAMSRAIAKTLELRVEPSPVPPPPPWPQVDLPADWGLNGDEAHRHLISAHGRCDVDDEELDVVAEAPASARHVLGHLHGTTMYWSVWSDRRQHHAETMVGAALRGQVHVVCAATSPAELEMQRALVEKLWP